MNRERITRRIKTASLVVAFLAIGFAGGLLDRDRPPEPLTDAQIDELREIDQNDLGGELGRLLEEAEEVE